MLCFYIFFWERNTLSFKSKVIQHNNYTIYRYIKYARVEDQHLILCNSLVIFNYFFQINLWNFFLLLFWNRFRLSFIRNIRLIRWNITFGCFFDKQIFIAMNEWLLACAQKLTQTTNLTHWVIFFVLFHPAVTNQAQKNAKKLLYFFSTSCVITNFTSNLISPSQKKTKT